jgi:hypothetical protein
MKSSSPGGSGSKSDKRRDGSQQEPSAEQRPSGQQQQAASGAGGQYGEGNYAATKHYNEGLKRHLENSDVEQEARDAAPKSASEESEMLEAERKGKSRARGEESPGRGPDSDEDLQ